MIHQICSGLGVKNYINGLQSAMNNIFLDFVIIDGESKESILNELRILGVDHSIIYPYLDGFGSSIASKFRQDFEDTL